MVHIMSYRHVYRSAEGTGLRLLALLMFCSLTASAQSTTHRGEISTAFSISATHLLGFENAKSNHSGTLSIHDDLLQFQQSGKPSVQVKIASVRAVVLGEESRQVGGLPMKLGKAAIPYSGGRVVSLVAHKKYDTLTLEYVDADAGVHGAIFELRKGQAEVVKAALTAQRVNISSRQGQSTKGSATEIRYENK
jgi:hypothetical protein